MILFLFVWPSLADRGIFIHSPGKIQTESGDIGEESGVFTVNYASSSIQGDLTIAGDIQSDSISSGSGEFVVVGMESPQAADVLDGLVVHYSFDFTLQDSVGGHDLEYYEVPGHSFSPGYGYSAELGMSYLDTTMNTRVKTVDPVNSWINPSSQSVAFWFRHDDSAWSHAALSQVHQIPLPDTHREGLYFHPWTDLGWGNPLSWVTAYGGGADIGNPFPTLDLESQTKWHHFALTWGSAQLCAYLDGVLSTCSDGTGDMVYRTDAYLFLAYDQIIEDLPSAGHEFQRGGFADYRIYDRPLSASEVMTLFSRKKVANPEQYLIVNWNGARYRIPAILEPELA